MKDSVKTICFVGVDGSGKSSTIELLRDQLGDKKVCVQYMGAKLWETKIGRKYHGHKIPHTWKNGVMFNLSLIYEMYYRVLKHHGEDKIVFFDRYVDELVIYRESGNNKIIAALYHIFFRWLFPRPEATFYFTCPIEISVKRKDDLSSEMAIGRLERNKKLLDGYYCKKKGVCVIDTSVLEQQRVVELIVEKCNL